MNEEQMKSFGGYLGLELSGNRNANSHNQFSWLLNTGRNALEFILSNLEIEKIHLPFYTCDAVLEPIRKLDIAFQFYRLDNNFEPIVDGTFGPLDYIIYTNYFGVFDSLATKVCRRFPRCILDNSQAFFSKTADESFLSFCSPRKFFGVPDGGIAYMEEPSFYLSLEQDVSLDRMGHLLKSVEFGTEAGYADFVANEKRLTGQPMQKMSLLTQALLNNIDLPAIKQQRDANFSFYHESLADKNKLSPLLYEKPNGPLVYPFLVDYGIELRNFLIENKVFIAHYWPNVWEWIKEEECVLESDLEQNLVALPVDQRLSLEDLDFIITMVNQFIDGKQQKAGKK